MRSWIGLGLLVPQLATAGVGPWVMGPGDGQIYAGLDVQRFRRLSVSTGSYAPEVIDVDDGVSSVYFKLIGSVGLMRGLELEMELPYGVVFTPTQDGPVCELLGLGACRRTQGIGLMSVRLKGLALDELYGPPVSLAFTLEARFGQLTAPDRERITNLGEGTFDLAPRVAIGRIGSLGQNGSWNLALDVGWRYRFPLRRQHDGQDQAVPGWEIDTHLESLFSPVTSVAFGPAVTWLYRPNGVNFEDVDLTDVDRLGALRISALSAGAKLIIRGTDRITVSTSVFHTLHAVNNPTDVFSFGVGVSLRDPFKRRTPPHLVQQ